MKSMVAAIAAALVATASAVAQEEIIVTGAELSAYESDIIPVVHLKRRADFLAAETVVESDSRDADLRRGEVLKTLESMIAKADRDSRIELGILRTFETDDDSVDYIEPFTPSALKDEILSGGGRSDTTRATIIVKTPITSADSFDSANGRLAAFTRSVPGAGRATVIGDDEPGLSVVDINQYRAQLLSMLAADNRVVQEVFGPDYRISISGLDQPVRWRVTGPLELAIYFPYSSSAAPG